MVEVEDLDEGEETTEQMHARMKEEAEWDDNNRALLAKGEKAISFEEWKGMQESEDTDPKAKGDPEALLKDVKVQKEVGFGAYRTGNYEKAKTCWAMARETLQQLVDQKRFKGKDAKETECKDLLFTLNLNLSQCYLKNKEFTSAISCAEKILAVDPKNVKAMYRKASGQMMGMNYKEAKETTNALLEVEPDNKAAKQLLMDIRDKVVASKEKSKKASRKIFGAFDGTDPRTVEHENRPEEVESWEDKIFDFLEDLYTAISTCSFCKKRKKS